jgi:hypothetical protein
MNFLILAFKAFVKALKNPKAAKDFLEEKKEEKCIEPQHLKLLFLLQKSGRLIDFLKEDIDPYSDVQIGAAVRKIHAECGKTLEELVAIRPLFHENEGSPVVVSQGYDPVEIKVTGKIKGIPPYQGILRHKGWKAHKMTLPKKIGEGDLSVIFPAEIEIK